MQALALAMEEARRLNSGHVGTAHLLIALLRDEVGVPYAVLTTLGAQPASVIGAAESRVRPSTNADALDRPVANSFKRALEGAVEEAAEMDEQLIRSDHLFLALLRTAPNPAADVLKDHHIALGPARTVVTKILGD